MATLPERLFNIVCGILFIGGCVAFAWGGLQHPSTSTSALGASDDIGYWRAFAEMAQHTPWSSLHTGLLAAPVLWALGGVGVHMTLRERGEPRWSALGSMALAMGAVAWAVAFVFDGYVALTHADAVLASNDTAIIPAIASLEAAEVVTLRMGLVAWLLIGVGMAALGSSLLATRMLLAPMRWLLGGAGILIGLWPIYAWATGIFLPGPFVSALWGPTVNASLTWFVAMGLVLIGLALRRPPHRISETQPGRT